MSIKGAADLVYTFRFIRMLTLKWEDFDAYKLGIINDKGERIKNVNLDSNAKRNAYTPFIRLVINIKRALQKIPGGNTKLGTFITALYLIKENYGIKEKYITKTLKKFNLESFDFIIENTEWFVLKDNTIAPGIYTIKDSTIINSTYEPVVNRKDKIRILENSKPIGEIFGISIYEAIHLKTNQKIYITTAGILK